MTSKKILVATTLLIFMSPLFGVILADTMGFHEPLDLAAKILNLQDLSETFNWTPLFNYKIPSLPPEVGYIISGFIGVILIFIAGLAINKLLKKIKR